MDGPGHLALARRNRDRAGSGGKRAADPEAKEVEPGVGGEPAAERGAEIPWTVEPGSAADDTVLAVAAFDPGRAIRWRAIVIGVAAILDPPIDITDHVIEAERIGLE